MKRERSMQFNSNLFLYHAQTISILTLSTKVSTVKEAMLFSCRAKGRASCMFALWRFHTYKNPAHHYDSSLGPGTDRRHLLFIMAVLSAFSNCCVFCLSMKTQPLTVILYDNALWHLSRVDFLTRHKKLSNIARVSTMECLLLPHC